MGLDQLVSAEDPVPAVLIASGGWSWEHRRSFVTDSKNAVGPPKTRRRQRLTDNILNGS